MAAVHSISANGSSWLIAQDTDNCYLHVSLVGTLVPCSFILKMGLKKGLGLELDTSAIILTLPLNHLKFTACHKDFWLINSTFCDYHRALQSVPSAAFATFFNIKSVENIMIYRTFFVFQLSPHYINNLQNWVCQAATENSILAQCTIKAHSVTDGKARQDVRRCSTFLKSFRTAE